MHSPRLEVARLLQHHGGFVVGEVVHLHAQGEGGGGEVERCTGGEGRRGVGVAGECEEEGAGEGGEEEGEAEAEGVAGGGEGEAEEGEGGVAEVLHALQVLLQIQ